MKTPEDILNKYAPVFQQDFDPTLKRMVLAAMAEYADFHARIMVLEYAQWYEENSSPPEHQNEDWMIVQNVKSFYDVRL